MTSEAQSDGIILLCDLDGTVQQVQQDELGLTDSHSPGRPFTALVHGDSLKTAFGFVEAVQSGEPAFGYGLYMRCGDDKVLLHINGYTLDKQMVITGARSRVIGSQLYHRTLHSHHKQVNAVYSALAAERSSHADRESELLGKVVRLQADGSALSAELAQTYAAQAIDPDQARDQAQHVVELTLANGRLQAELAQWSAAAEAQREAEATFAGIFRAGPVGMAVSARSDGRLLHVNAQLEHLLDYRPGELTGQPLHKLLAQGSRSVLGKVEAQLSVPHAPLELATKFRTKDGSSRDLLAAFELAELHGELFLLTAVMVAHEHVQSEHEVQENEQLRRELTVQSTALRQEVRLLQEDVRAYKLREQSLADQAGTLREKIRTLEGELALREQRELLLSSNIAAYQPDARERTLNAQVTSLREAKHELSAQVAALQEQAAQAEAAAAEHKEREQTLVNQVTAVQRLNFRIEALHGAMEEGLKRQLAELQQQQSALEAELTRRRQSEDELSHLAANLLESAANHETELSGFRQREQTLLGQLTEMRAEALLQEQELKAQLEGLKEQATTVQPELTGHQQPPARANSGRHEFEAAVPAEAVADQSAAAQSGNETLAPAPGESPAAVAQLHTRITGLQIQVGQLQAELNRRAQAQHSQMAISQGRAELLERQIRERREAERALLSRIKEWRDRVATSADSPGLGVEREQALLEQIDRLEQHIQASAEASQLIGNAASGLRQAQTVREQNPATESPAVLGRSLAVMRDDTIRAQTEQELRNELGALHLKDQERIRHLSSLQAQLGLRELELLERKTTPNVSAGSSHVVSSTVHTARAAPTSADIEPLTAARVTVEPASAIEQAADAAGMEVEAPSLQARDAHVIIQSIPTPEVSVIFPEVDLAARNALASLARDATDLPSILTMLAAEFGHQMHADGSCLLLWDEVRQQMLPGAGYGLYAGVHSALQFDQAELNIFEPILTTGHSLAADDALAGSSGGSKQGNYSTLSLPLTSRAERLGIALITFDQTHHFTPEEIERGEKFALQVATAIAHTRRQVDTQRRMEALTAAQRAGRRLQPLRTREALAAEIRTVLGESFNYAYAEVLLMETGTGELSTLLAEPRNPQAGAPYKFAELARRDIRTQVIRTWKGVRLTDVREGPLREHGVLCVPLWLDDQVSGVLYLESSTSSTFTELDQQVLEMVAASVAGAVENARAFELIAQQHRQLRTLTMQLAGGEDAARRQMARQLQMEVGQSLMMLSISLDNLPVAGAAEGLLNIKAKVDGAQKQLDDITRNVRDVIAELHPPALDELGLAGALRYYGGRFSERTGVPAIVNSDTWVRRLPPAVEAVLFRIAQETLTRVNRFDPIKPIRITLDDSGDTSSLSITGAGVGVSASGAQDLGRLQERAAAIGGEVRLESGAGHETRLIVELANADVNA